MIFPLRNFVRRLFFELLKDNGDHDVIRWWIPSWPNPRL